MSFRPDPETLRWAAGQVLAWGPRTPDTTPLRCAEHYIRDAARLLREHADYLDTQPAASKADVLALIEAAYDQAFYVANDRYLCQRLDEARELIERL